MNVGYIRPVSLEGDRVELELWDRQPAPRGARIVGRGHESVRLGRIEVAYTTTDDTAEVLSVKVQQLDEPMTPTALQRFPWAKVLASAAAHRRAAQTNALSDWQDIYPRPRRPGRPPLPVDHLQAIATEYENLIKQGSRTPTKAIADVYEVEVKLARSWVNKARKRGLLPPGQPGRAG